MVSGNKDASGNKEAIIKKYANRRLYDMEASSYITQEQLANMVREGREFKVLDAKTGKDITRTILTQIIVEEEGRRGQTMLPVSFLRKLISMYGNNMQSIFPSYLEASMDAFCSNQEKLYKSIQGVFPTKMIPGARSIPQFGELTRHNFEVFQSALAMMTGAGAENEEDPKATPDKTELDILKKQLSDLQARLDRLSDDT